MWLPPALCCFAATLCHSVPPQGRSPACQGRSTRHVLREQDCSACVALSGANPPFLLTVPRASHPSPPTFALCRGSIFLPALAARAHRPAFHECARLHSPSVAGTQQALASVTGSRQAPSPARPAAPAAQTLLCAAGWHPAAQGGRPLLSRALRTRSTPLPLPPQGRLQARAQGRERGGQTAVKHTALPQVLSASGNSSSTQGGITRAQTPPKQAGGREGPTCRCQLLLPPLHAARQQLPPRCIQAVQQQVRCQTWLPPPQEQQHV